MINYSQNREQDVIIAHFKDKPPGKFLDIGAYDGKTLSNTYALALCGWSGVMVEPSSYAFSAMLNNMIDLPDITLINGAMTPDTDGFILFYDSFGDALTTSSPDHLNKWRDVKFKQFYTNAFSLNTFIETYGSDYDFISLDTESTNWEMINAIMARIDDFKNLSMICVEYDNKFMEIQSLMNSKGFTTIHINGENQIFIRK